MGMKALSLGLLLNAVTAMKGPPSHRFDWWATPIKGGLPRPLTSRSSSSRERHGLALTGKYYKWNRAYRQEPKPEGSNFLGKGEVFYACRYDGLRSTLTEREKSKHTFMAY